jgi:hypothetical protein
MLDIAAVLDNVKESLEVTLTQQLRQSMFFLRLAQPEFPPRLLADVGKAS